MESSHPVAIVPPIHIESKQVPVIAPLIAIPAVEVGDTNAPSPIATELVPFAVVSSPIATELVPFAVAVFPIATELAAPITAVFPIDTALEKVDVVAASPIAIDFEPPFTIAPRPIQIALVLLFPTLPALPISTALVQDVPIVAPMAIELSLDTEAPCPRATLKVVDKAFAPCPIATEP
jgi:hypothetical protein